MPVLTPNAFELLLARLDSDSSGAAQSYEELRQKLTKFFIWRGSAESNADTLADETLDRVAAKLAQGLEIQSIKAYSCETGRYVWLEYQRKNKEDNFGDETPEIAVEAEFPEDPDLRIACLRSCLVEITNDENDQVLILGYYDTENVGKIKDQRKSLAEKLGLTANTLKVKASRLRDRLEKCINECVRKRTSPVTN